MSIHLKNISLTVTSKTNLESVASQLQAHCEQILYVVDGDRISFDAPTGDLVVESQNVNDAGKEEYYIRDSASDTLYCCFSGAVKDSLIAPVRRGDRSDRVASKKSGGLIKCDIALEDEENLKIIEKTKNL